jgi:LacI family transcriptional regulator
VQHLAALGHVHIAFVSGPANLKTAMMRKFAFQTCMNEIGLKSCPELIFEGDHTIEAGMKAISALAALPNRPTSVICSNDLTAIGVMRQAFDLSLDVPRDLSVVGFDDIRFAQFLIPPLTTVQMSQTEIAEIAFTALLECVEGDGVRRSTKGVVVTTNLVLRRSTTLAPHRRIKADVGTNDLAVTDFGRGSSESPLFP